MKDFCKKQVSMGAVIAIVVVSLIVGVVGGKCMSKHGYGHKGGYGAKHGMMMGDKMQQKMTGTWQSMDDVKSVREYKSDGTMSDIYDAEELGSGTWAMTHKRKGATLTTVISGEEYMYTIEKLSDSELIMMHMPRGNVLRYSKIVNEE